MQKKLGKDAREERTGIMIGRIFCLVIAALFLIFGVFFKPACDLDAGFLGCRLTGTVADWIGSILFVGGLLILSGIHKGINNLYNPPGSVGLGIAWFVLMVLGVVLFWNL